MKTCLKLALPLTLATLLANADQLEFTKNMPLDSKTVAAFNEYALPTYDTYDHKVDVGSWFFSKSAAVTYTRVKPDSTFIGVSGSFTPYSVGIMAMGGYNFLLSPKDILTPAAGLYYNSGIQKKIYPMMGLQYEHAFNNVFSIGADFVTAIKGDFNISVGVPFTFHFGHQKRWEVQLTPWMTHTKKWPVSSNEATLHCSLGYRF